MHPAPGQPGYRADRAVHPPAPLTAKQRLDHVFNVVSTISLSYFKSLPCLYPVQWGKGWLMCPSGHLLCCTCRAPRCGRGCRRCAGSAGRLLGLMREHSFNLGTWYRGKWKFRTVRNSLIFLLKLHLNHHQKMQAPFLQIVTQPRCWGTSCGAAGRRQRGYQKRCPPVLSPSHQSTRDEGSHPQNVDMLH